MAWPEAGHINQLWATLMVEELVRQGAGPFFLSPGSRCTPLTIAAARHPGATCHTHFDERGMAFLALGHAKATGRPAVLICTSGTAVANYLPAVVEASQAHVPLVLLTADRPPELLDCGANQAIVQPGIFGASTRWAASVPCPDEAVPPQALLTTIGHAVHRAAGVPPGPVHLNCMYREPLAPVDDARDFADYLLPVTGWVSDQRPYTASLQSVLRPADAYERLVRDFRDARTGLLVAGALRSEEERRAVADLAARLGWPAVPDVLSGLRLGCPGPPWLPFFDQMLLSAEFGARFRPDAVLHVGGTIVSKRLQSQLEAWRPEYIRLTSYPSRHDPGHVVRHHCVCDIAVVCHCLAALLGDAANPRPELMQLGDDVDAAVSAFLADSNTLSEIQVARTVSELRPSGCALVLGNSMPVRDMDMYAVAGGAGGPVHANRGASGIDGNIATAAGIARATPGATIAVVGDLAALHDLNSFVMLSELPQPFVVVVINNDGGGIFSFLPVSGQTDVFEQHFAMSHGRGFEQLAAAFGVSYHAPHTVMSFEDTLRHALAANGASVIEVSTNREENAALHRDLQERITRLMSGTRGY